MGCAAYNFDHPDAFDTAAMLECLTNLKVGVLTFLLGLVFHDKGAQPVHACDTALQGSYNCFTPACLPFSVCRLAAWLQETGHQAEDKCFLPCWNRGAAKKAPWDCRMILKAQAVTNREERDCHNVKPM